MSNPYIEGPLSFSSHPGSVFKATIRIPGAINVLAEKLTLFAGAYVVGSQAQEGDVVGNRTITASPSSESPGADYWDIPADFKNPYAASSGIFRIYLKFTDADGK